MNRELIKATRGKFMSITFVKKDGTVRHMNARLGVRKHLRGGAPAYDAESKGLVILFDTLKKDYRAVCLDRVTEFSCGNLKWPVA